MTTPEHAWSDPKVLASRSVLVEVMTILGAEVDKLVVVGGWVPELLYPGRGHMGSLDVDLALDGRKIQPAAYDSIRKRLVAAGYVQTSASGSIFFREMAAGSFSVRLDLITGEGLVPRDEEPNALIQEMVVGKLRGTDLALDHAVSITVTGVLPDRSVNEVNMRVANVAAFLCMKAHALNERKREKDAYDIYFCLRAADGGSKALAENLRPLLGQVLVDDAMQVLRSKFAAIDRVGPQWAAQVASEQGEDFEQVARDAFERMYTFLAVLREPRGGASPTGATAV
ncbi:MAG: nucleotidyl transferase AbiEii/AbiGii toxin family protein [Planctomycetes bacterium]|nr:nucleotidyl transferase AbiEii/AbiGii toxin family protein [Planctomycetota bacterium]